MRWERWRARTGKWGPALVLLLVNLSLLFAYRLALTVRVANREAALETQRQQLADLESERDRLGVALATARRTSDEIEQMRTDRFGTQAGRLTATMLRVKQLARDSGLRGLETISYPEEGVEEFGLVKKSFIFGVNGTYQQLRRFVNLLEVHESFLTLEEIQVAEDSAAGQLKIRVRLATMFVDPGAERPSS